MAVNRRMCTFGIAVAASIAAPALRADNQTVNLSPISAGDKPPITVNIGQPTAFSSSLPGLQSFAAGTYEGPTDDHSEWLLLGGLSGGLHNLGFGFSPTFQNSTLYVIDPVTQQVWSRSIQTDANSGLTQDQIDSLSSTNNEYTQQGSNLYVVGGFGQSQTTFQYGTFDTLTSINMPGLINWVKGGAGTAAANITQIHDPMFQVTGGEAVTSGNGTTQVIFGQYYPDNYDARENGIYTDQVRSFQIVDNAQGLSVTNVVMGPQADDYRRRDLDVVPIIQKVNGQLMQSTQALAGVFTPTFGVWTVPVTIDANGNATEPDPTAASTFKQGMNGYRAGTVGLYSAKSNTMHTILFGGISYEYTDGTGQIQQDPEIPFINDVTDIVTDSNGNMTQHLLPHTFPAIAAPTNGTPLLFGAEAEFFLKDGIATYSNGVIDLDALTGPTLIGWLYGGIAADAGDGGNTSASNYMFPVVTGPEVDGDADQDGVKDLDDYLEMDEGYLKQLTGYANGDLNGDGVVNGADYAIIDGGVGPGVAGVVPEPASLGVLLLGSLGIFRIRSKRLA